MSPMKPRMKLSFVLLFSMLASVVFGAPLGSHHEPGEERSVLDGQRIRRIAVQGDDTDDGSTPQKKQIEIVPISIGLAPEVFGPNERPEPEFGVKRCPETLAASENVVETGERPPIVKFVFLRPSRTKLYFSDRGPVCFVFIENCNADVHHKAEIEAEIARDDCPRRCKKLKLELMTTAKLPKLPLNFHRKL